MKKKNKAVVSGKKPICPYCNAQSEIRSLAEVTGNKNSKGKVFVCKNFPECNSYVKVNDQTGLPMGTMANKHLRDLRAEAHRQIARLYADGLGTRDSTYEWMASRLGLNRRETHIGLFQEYYCLQVIRMAEEEYSRRVKKQNSSGRRLKKVDGREV